MMYGYGYVGDTGRKVHILPHDGQGRLCRRVERMSSSERWWTPNEWQGLTVGSGDLWNTLVAADTLCARCRQRFETLTAPPS